MVRYSQEPHDQNGFTQSFDRVYTRLARAYDAAVKALPVWKAWLRPALQYLNGPRVLEVSFGTGYLMTEYAGRFEVHGLDLNARMIAIARFNLEQAGVGASLCRGTVEALPYRSDSFDCVLNTMAFSGYPDGRKALRELVRVLKPGRLVLIDINYPADRNRLGTWLTEFWQYAGDLIRDMDAPFREFALSAVDREVGGWGSVHLYIVEKGASVEPLRAEP
jgi:ubiquinone/menaquinone biosynthesis C-methylase UbiE